jgi:GST-like protein
MPITFYAAPFSSATPVAAALYELDVPHERIDLDLSAGDQRTPAHLARNPNGKVPTLVADGVAMFEALAIMLWLGDRHGVRCGLWPAADAPERMTAMAWSTWAYVTLTAGVYRLNQAQSERSPAELHSKVHAAAAKRDLDEHLRILDEHLASRAYVLGDAYSLADIIVGCAVLYARMCGAPVDAHPRVAAWAERVRGREAVARAWR